MKKRLITLFVLIAIMLVGLITPGEAQVSTPAELFISEYIEGSSYNKAIEIYNGTGGDVDLAAGLYTLELYSNGAATPSQTLALSGTIASGDVYVLAHPSADAAILAQADVTNGSVINFNGDDAVVLRKDGAVIDAFGQIGVDPGSQWPGGGQDDTLRRLSSVCEGDTDATDAFDASAEWEVFPQNTFDGLGSHTADCGGVVVNAPVIAICGSWLNTYEGKAATREVSASDADGTVVSISIETSPVPTSGAIHLENFVTATAIGGTATGDVVVDANVPDGIYAVTVTALNDEAEAQEGSCIFNVDVDPFLTIGEVQGIVTDDDSGTNHTSPYEGEYVAVQGVIYEKTQEYRSSGGAYYGFFIQNTADTSDGDPSSSDGIFVFHYQYPTLLVDGGGTYFPVIGDEVILWGQIQERFNNTRFNNPRLAVIVRSGVDLDAEIPAFSANPPANIIDDQNFDDLQDAYRYWERREGMRGQIPAGSTILNGRDVFASTFDSEIWVAQPDSLIAQRTEAYERRAFRDVHPLDDIPTVGFDNDNPYRILIGTFGVKAAEDDTTALLSPSRTYDVLENAPIGGVYFNFGKYSIQVDQQIDLSNGVDPSLNNPPQAFSRDLEYSVVTFNLENLYDYYDDPFDGCDFQDNAGCPGVSPPFDYVPASDEVYQARLNEIAQQIVGDLHSPDIILAQEVEDQDVCTLSAGVYDCPDPSVAVDNLDGKPDTLQELAAAIVANGGPIYEAAFDRDGADDRGIISAYLYRADRVELLPAMADDPVLGDTPTIYYPDGAPLPYNTDVQNPKALNAVLPDYVTGPTDGDNVFTRPPQVGLFRMWRDGVGTSVFTDMYISDNHFSSGPDNRVDQRTEQASYNAAIVAALQEVDSEVYVSVGGDLNVYPRPDDPFPPPNTSDQLAGLYNQEMVNLWDMLVNEAPVSAYSYIYQGQSQTLDQMFVTPAWMTEFVQGNSAHINSDFPADYPGDGPRGTSDHDPLVARYSLLPSLDRLESLLYYFDSMGDIYGNNTLKIMLDRLDRARKFEAKGQMDAYADQLYAFASQAQDFVPDQMSQEAADTLEQEALLLLSLP